MLTDYHGGEIALAEGVVVVVDFGGTEEFTDGGGAWF